MAMKPDSGRRIEGYKFGPGRAYTTQPGEIVSLETLPWHRRPPSVMHMDSRGGLHRIDILNFSEAARVSFADAQDALVQCGGHVVEELPNDALIRMLRADSVLSVPFIPQADPLFGPVQPRTRFRDIDAVVWLRTFFAALRRELYGPAHLRRYL